MRPKSGWEIFAEQGIGGATQALSQYFGQVAGEQRQDKLITDERTFQQGQESLKRIREMEDLFMGALSNPDTPDEMKGMAQQFLEQLGSITDPMLATEALANLGIDVAQEREIDLTSPLAQLHMIEGMPHNNRVVEGIKRISPQFFAGELTAKGLAGSRKYDLTTAQQLGMYQHALEFVSNNMTQPREIRETFINGMEGILTADQLTQLRNLAGLDVATVTAQGYVENPSLLSAAEQWAQRDENGVIQGFDMDAMHEANPSLAMAVRAAGVGMARDQIEAMQVGAAARALGLEGLGYEVQTQAANLDLTKLQVEDFTNEVTRRTERHFEEMLTSTANRRMLSRQITQLEQAIEHSGIDFTDRKKDESYARILAAAAAGSDARLDDDEKAVLAAYMGVDADSEGYHGRLASIAEENFAQASHIRQAQEIANRASSLGADLTAEQVAAAKTQAQWDDYSRNRQVLLNGATDAMSLDSSISEIVNAGDVNGLETVLLYLENPHLNPSMHQLLMANGYTKERLESLMDTAREINGLHGSERQLVGATLEAEQRKLVRGEQADQITLGQMMADYFTPEQLDALTPQQVAIMGGPLARDAAKVRSAFTQTLRDEEVKAPARERAWRRIQTLAQAPQDPANVGAAAQALENEFYRLFLLEDLEPEIAAELAGQSAQGFATAWQRGATGFDMEMAMMRAEIGYKNALAQAALMKGTGDGKYDATLANAQIAALGSLRTTINDAAAADGCVIRNANDGFGSSPTLFADVQGRAPGYCDSYVVQLHEVTALNDVVTQSLDLPARSYSWLNPPPAPEPEPEPLSTSKVPGSPFLQNLNPNYQEGVTPARNIVNFLNPVPGIQRAGEGIGDIGRWLFTRPGDNK